MELLLRTFDLQLQYRFRIAHDSRDVQSNLVVEIRDGARAGFGEATASKYYGRAISGMVDVLEEHRALIEGYDYQPPEEFWETCRPKFDRNSFAQSALDVAIHDLYAKHQNKSLIDLWGGEPANIPQTNFTIGIDTVENMVARLQDFPWPLYKIKLGTDDDLGIVRELRKVTKATFRIDANCGWEVDQALVNIRAMKDLGVEFIEQPLAQEDWDGMKYLFRQSPLDLVADESIQRIEDVDKASGHFHGINIKLMKCGGYTPAFKMMKKARTLGLKVMAGCMTESSVGIAGLAQIGPWLDYADMDGSTLVINDIADGPKLENGKFIMPSGPGIGIQRLQMDK